MTFWSLHTHSAFSVNDAMTPVPQLVARAVELGYPALGLTDHGTVSGAVQLYKACRKAGIEPLPGQEFYLTVDREMRSRKNYHLTVAAYSETGYRNLVGLHNLAHRNFWFKPVIDLADLAGLAAEGRLQGLAAASGCYFGLVTQTLLARGPAAARRLMETLAGWFPRFYVELHNHYVKHEDGSTDLDIVAQLVTIADEAGLPYMIAQDNHYAVPEEQHLHDSLKTLVSWSPDDPDDAIFPGGPYSMYSHKGMSLMFPKTVFERAVANLDELADKACVRLPELETFSLRVPDVTVSGDAYTELEQRVIAKLTELLEGASAAKRKRCLGRLNEELEVVRASGYADYLLLAAMICAFMRDSDIWYQTRGSASGSLICYLLEVTQVDPVHYDLRMDRFMSKDRTKPPDIDLDVEDTRRDEVIAMLSRNWTVRQICNYITYKIQPDKEHPDDDAAKGSLARKYYSTAGKKGVKIDSWAQIPKADQETLRSLGQMGLMSTTGTHASGFLVTPDEVAARQVPLNRMKRGEFVTAFAMKDIEALGFVKFDLLGLKTLTAMKIACQTVHARLVTEGKVDPASTPREWFDSIPLNDRKVYQRIGRGDTEGVFQLDGWSMSKGCRELKPRHLEDLIAAQALFRPAARDSGATRDFLARRSKKAVVPERHPDITAETSETYGVLLYQEQVIGVLRRLGMDADELTEMLTAVKASNSYSAGAALALEAAKPRIKELATDRDWSEEDIDWLLGALVAYGEYSFNRAHAAAYGIAAYRSAWLAEHYPTEFWFGVISAYSRSDKEKYVVRAARGHGVKVVKPHVNTSSVSYSYDPVKGAIRRGLVSIKGVGPSAATELVKHAPFSSLEDLCIKVVPQKVTGTLALATGTPAADCPGVVALLAEAGALDGLS